MFCTHLGSTSKSVIKNKNLVEEERATNLITFGKHDHNVNILDKKLSYNYEVL